MNYKRTFNTQPPGGLGLWFRLVLDSPECYEMKEAKKVIVWHVETCEPEPSKVS